ncbi:MAG: orotate phosphoribosyltransferase [Clostridiales bacterium]|nr:orotate phosphoribosyltransferase [Clostridiales bacterium]
MIPKPFIDTHAYQQGHFRLRNGQHTNSFLQCAYLVRDPKQTQAICQQLADLCAHSGAQVVIGPALGGMIFGYEISRMLGLAFLYTERKDKAMTMRRGFTLARGTKVLIIEDVVTTGGSVREIIEIVKALGGEVVMVAALADRSGGKVDFSIPFVRLISINVEKWQPDVCPLCAKDVPLEKPFSEPVGQVSP